MASSILFTATNLFLGACSSTEDGEGVVTALSQYGQAVFFVSVCVSVSAHVHFLFMQGTRVENLPFLTAFNLMCAVHSESLSSMVLASRTIRMLCVSNVLFCFWALYWGYSMHAVCICSHEHKEAPLHFMPFLSHSPLWLMQLPCGTVFNVHLNSRMNRWELASCRLKVKGHHDTVVTLYAQTAKAQLHCEDSLKSPAHNVGVWTDILQLVCLVEVYNCKEVTQGDYKLDTDVLSMASGEPTIT